MKTIKRNWTLLVIVLVLGLKYGTAQTITPTSANKVYQQYVELLVKSIDSTIKFENVVTSSTLETKKSYVDDSFKVQENFTFEVYPFFTVQNGETKYSEEYKSFTIKVELLDGTVNKYNVTSYDLAEPKKIGKAPLSPRYRSTYIPRYRSTYIPRYRSTYIPRRY